MPKAAEAYEIVEAKNDLRSKVREVRGTAGDDPVTRAEAALRILSTHFDDWIADEIAGIERGFAGWVAAGTPDGAKRDAFYRSVHDLKGQATTLGFPLVTRVAGTLCALLEGIDDGSKLPVPLLDQHVKAIRAIYREKARDESDKVGAALAKTLCDVSDGVLAGFGRGEDRPAD